MYLYVCISCTYTCVYIHTKRWIFAGSPPRIYIYVHIYTYIHIRIYIHTRHIYIYVHTSHIKDLQTVQKNCKIHICMYKYMYITQYMYVYVYCNQWGLALTLTYIHTYIHTYIQEPRMVWNDSQGWGYRDSRVSAFMSVCMYVCMEWHLRLRTLRL